MKKLLLAFAFASLASAQAVTPKEVVSTLLSDTNWTEFAEDSVECANVHELMSTVTYPKVRDAQYKLVRTLSYLAPAPLKATKNEFSTLVTHDPLLRFTMPWRQLDNLTQRNFSSKELPEYILGAIMLPAPNQADQTAVCLQIYAVRQ